MPRARSTPGPGQQAGDARNCSSAFILGIVLTFCSTAIGDEESRPMITSIATQLIAQVFTALSQPLHSPGGLPAEVLSRHCLFLLAWL